MTQTEAEALTEAEAVTEAEAEAGKGRELRPRRRSWRGGDDDTGPATEAAQFTVVLELTV